MTKEKVTGKCALCLQEKELRESHLIPKFIYKQTKLLPKHQKVYKILGNEVIEEKNYKWDGTKIHLLCADCENIFGEFENYYANVFYGKEIPKAYNITTEEIKIQGQLYLCYENIDYEKVKLFLLSVIWRLSICPIPSFRYVELENKHNEIIRKMLLNKSAGYELRYQLMLIKPNYEKAEIKHTEPFAGFWTSDRKGKYYIGMLGGYGIVFKLGQQGKMQTIWEMMMKIAMLRKNNTMNIWLVIEEHWNFILYKFLGVGERLEATADFFEKLREANGKS